MISRNSLIILTLLIGLSVSIGPALADQDGKGDSDQSCFGCHREGGSGIVDITVISETVEVDQTGNIITITVNVDSINDDNYIVGVMLLNDDGGNIVDDGWTISSDPNGNASPYNYNEKTGLSGDTEYSWSVAAPTTPGEYTIKTRTMYGGDNANYQESQPITIPVNVAPEVPVDDTNGIVVNGDAPEGVNLEGLKIGLFAGFGALIVVLVLRKRW